MTIAVNPSRECGPGAQHGLATVPLLYRPLWARAKGLLSGFARSAVAIGGTVSAEHGLRKRKREFPPIQFSAGEIAAMKR